MWFKNLRIFRLSSDFQLNHEQLNEKLSEHEFQSCGKLDLIRSGWTFPLGRQGTEFVHSASGYLMISLKREEKILPSAVIKEHLEQKVSEISEAESRHVGRKEKEDLKDEVIFSLLPKAFTKSRNIFAYISPKEKLIVVDSSSAKLAEDLISALRDAIGSLPCTPLAAKNPPSSVMTQWIRDKVAPQPFELGEECEVRAPKDGAVIRCKNQDLTADEFISHIDTGMLVSKLAVTWREGINMIIDDEFSVKRLKFEEGITDKAESAHADTAAQEFDQEFAIMTIELSSLIKELLQVFGGEGEFVSVEE